MSAKNNILMLLLTAFSGGPFAAAQMVDRTTIAAERVATESTPGYVAGQRGSTVSTARQQRSVASGAHHSSVEQPIEHQTYVQQTSWHANVPLSPARESLRPVNPSAESSIRTVAHSGGVSTVDANLETAPVASTEQPAFLDLRADVPQQPEAASTAEASNGTEMIIHLVTWTVIILCLCVLTVLGLRRWQAQRGMLPPTRMNARVLETIALGPSRSVSLVQLRNVQALVGCDASGIRSIVIANQSFDDTMLEAGFPADELHENN